VRVIRTVRYRQARFMGACARKSLQVKNTTVYNCNFFFCQFTLFYDAGILHLCFERQLSAVPECAFACTFDLYSWQYAAKQKFIGVTFRAE
jgi:hypothetical protein